MSETAGPKFTVVRISNGDTSEFFRFSWGNVVATWEGWERNENYFLLPESPDTLVRVVWLRSEIGIKWEPDSAMSDFPNREALPLWIRTVDIPRGEKLDALQVIDWVVARGRKLPPDLEAIAQANDAGRPAQPRSPKSKKKRNRDSNCIYPDDVDTLDISGAEITLYLTTNGCCLIRGEGQYAECDIPFGPSCRIVSPETAAETLLLNGHDVPQELEQFVQHRLQPPADSDSPLPRTEQTSAAKYLRVTIANPESPGVPFAVDLDLSRQWNLGQHGEDWNGCDGRYNWSITETLFKTVEGGWVLKDERCHAEVDFPVYPTYEFVTSQKAADRLISACFLDENIPDELRQFVGRRLLTKAQQEAAAAAKMGQLERQCELFAAERELCEATKLVSAWDEYTRPLKPADKAEGHRTDSRPAENTERPDPEPAADKTDSPPPVDATGAFQPHLKRKQPPVDSEVKPAAPAAESTNETPAADDVEHSAVLPELLSAPALAKHLGQTPGRVESFLRRYRDKYPDCYREADGKRRNEPRYLYRTRDVLPALQSWDG